MMLTEMLVLTVIFPLTAAILSFAIKQNHIRNIIVVFLGLCNFIGIINIYRGFTENSETYYIKIIEILPRLEIAFKVSELGLIFAMIVGLLWPVTYIYANSYMVNNNEKNLARFFGFFHIALAATFALAFSDNLLALFIFYEILTLSTYPLVAHKGNKNSKRGARTYLTILLTTSLMLFLPAILILWYNLGNVTFAEKGIIAGNLEDKTALILLFMFIFGVGKAAIMPIHRWLPAAMVAPTPVSALLHAVAVVKAGVFTIVQIISQIYGIDYLQGLFEQYHIASILLYIAGFTIIAASITALYQDNLKKRLAYSTVSQLSYIIMSALILTPISLMAASFHIAAHAFAKISLFFAAGSIYTATGKTKISELNAIGKIMPLTMIAFSIGALSMIGVPLTVGFVSKYYLILGALSAENLFVITVIIISTLLNAAYFLPIIIRAFFFVDKDKIYNFKEAPLGMGIAISITAFLTIFLFFKPEIFLNLIK